MLASSPWGSHGRETPTIGRVTFELDRFALDRDRLELVGRWFGVRGRLFIRPTLTFPLGRRLLADLDHKPWLAHDGQPWRATFALDAARRQALGPAQLSVGPDVSIELPAPEVGEEEREPAEDALPRRPAPARRAEEALDELRAELHTALAARDAAVADREVALALRDAALAERDTALAQRDAVRAELDALVAQRDAAVAERDAALAARDAAVAERDAAAAKRRRPRQASTG